jgi:predicted solute-binding protein
MPFRLGVPEAAYLQPLLLQLPSEVQLHTDAPAQLALKFRDRIPPLDEAGCAFLSPLDYARHGADYRILPGSAVSSSAPNGSIRLYVKSGLSNISSVAVDVRFTSEIILARIILMEKFPNLASREGNIQFIPMMAGLHGMLAKADAALIVNPTPLSHRSDIFALDLVEEWNDLTELPYVYGFWVGRDESEEDPILGRLRSAFSVDDIRRKSAAARIAQRYSISHSDAEDYLAAFSYLFGKEQKESLSEFIHYAFYHGVIPDVPEINFFEDSSASSLN